MQVQKLLRQQRLVLILDLDHTLVQSVRLSDLDKDTEALLVSMNISIATCTVFKYFINVHYFFSQCQRQLCEHVFDKPTVMIAQVSTGSWERLTARSHVWAFSPLKQRCGAIRQFCTLYHWVEFIWLSCRQGTQHRV